MVVVAPPPSYQGGLDYEALVLRRQELSIDEISTKWEQMRVKWEWKWKWKWSEDKSSWLMRPVLCKGVTWNRYFRWKRKMILKVDTNVVRVDKSNWTGDNEWRGSILTEIICFLFHVNNKPHCICRKMTQIQDQKQNHVWMKHQSTYSCLFWGFS